MTGDRVLTMNEGTESMTDPNPTRTPGSTSEPRPEEPTPRVTSEPTSTPEPNDDVSVSNVIAEDRMNMARNFDAVELVCDPESPLIQEFYNKLVSFFQETEVEPLETFKQEIRSGKCSLFVIKNLKGEIIDFAYGSLISYAEDKNLLAFRFTGAEVDPLIQPGQGADQRLIEHFQRESSVDALLVEATSKKAGKRWYRVKVEEGNGMQWVYIPSGDSMNFGLSDVPIDYFLPPFEWNSDDGTPCDAQLLLKPQSEYLQLAFKGSSDSISIEELRALLTALWESWYIRPKNEFDNDDAWQKHKAIVMALLNDKILKPLENFPSLDLQIPD